MSNIHETTQVFSVATAVVVAFCFLVASISGCTENQDTQREKTKQEAIKAGLVEGEYGRWVKPEEMPR